MKRQERLALVRAVQQELERQRENLDSIARDIRVGMATIAGNEKNRGDWNRMNREASQLERASERLGDSLVYVGRAFRPLRAPR